MSLKKLFQLFTAPISEKSKNSKTPKLEGNEKAQYREEEKFVEIQFTKPICPYCKVTLEPIPKRSTKCKSCQNHIHLLKGPRTKKQLFLSDNTKNIINTEKEKLRQEKYIVEVFKRFGGGESEFINLKKDTKNQLNTISDYHDFNWMAFNHLLERHCEDFHTLSMIYYEMAIYLSKKGEDFTNVLSLSKQNQLLQKKKQGVEKIVILNSDNNSCPECKKINNKVLDIDNALNAQILPCKTCAHNGGFCRCYYSPDHLS